MKKRLGRVLSVILATAMVCSLAACGGGDKQEQKATEDKKKDYVWVSEFYELDEDSNIYSAKEKDGFLYYESYEIDQEAKENKYLIKSISLTDGSAGPSYSFVFEENKRKEEDKDAEVRTGRNTTAFVPTDEGIVTLENVFQWKQETGEEDSQYYICKYDQSGAKLSETDITEVLGGNEENRWIVSMEMDEQGRIYLNCETEVIMLDAEGKYHGTVSMPGEVWIQAMGMGKDGKMYLSYFGITGTGASLQEVDYEGKKLGAKYENCFSESSSSSLTKGINKDFLLISGGAVCEYDMETQTSEEMINLLDSNINASYVCGVYGLEDGRVACITNNWESNKSELAILTKKDASEVKVKKEITLAGLFLEPTVQEAAVQFNKNNDEYQITMKNYCNLEDIIMSGNVDDYEKFLAECVTRMNNEITSDNCPDILMISGVDVERLAAKGAFEDLNNWMNQSTVVKREDYFESILNAFTYNDVLISIPKSFELSTLAGRASHLGTESGWTVEEMVAYGKEHPEAALVQGLTKEYALELILQYNQSSYIDWSTGKCNFDNDSFISLLEFANNFPEEFDYDMEGLSEATQIANGKLLLTPVYLYDFQSVQVPAAMFSDDICYIGLPNDKGESGTYLSASTGLAIMANSDCKEGAWAFLENYLADSEEDLLYGFATKKADFEKAKEEALKVEYIKDINGEIMLDENGEPMTQGSTSSIGFGDDWTYTYHDTTQEEVALLEELIANAKPANSADTTIMNIVKEEAGAYFKGQRSAKDVAGIIQSRVQVYVNENR